MDIPPPHPIRPLKEFHSASAIAWAPAGHNPFLLAAGNVQGTLDDNFQTTSRLELYSTDPAITHKQPEFLGSVAVAQCNFSKIAWGAKGIQEQTYPYGILAGGMSTGSLNLWDASKIPQEPDAALLARVDKHQGPILGLDFNSQQPNLLASASSDGEVFVWDLMKVNSPAFSRPSADAQVVSRFGVSAVAWNPQVPYILASSSSNGETYVWDLRQKRSILNFQDSSRTHSPATSVAWDPLQPRQLVVTYSNPTPEVWDLRNSMTPKAYLQGGHSRGVLSARWNPHDQRFLVTSGDDSISSVWSSDGYLLHQFSHDGVPFEFEWNPQSPGMFATSLYNGMIQVKNIHYVGKYIVPNWIGEKTGASFGFGGKLVSFPGPTLSSVSMSNVVTENDFMSLYRSFQQVIDSRGPEQICEDKIYSENSQDAEELKTWEFIKALFQENAPFHFRSMLGFAPQSEFKAGGNDSNHQEDVDAQSFFDSIGQDFSPGRDKPSQSKQSSKASRSEEEVDELIKSSLLIGDYASAVKKCFESSRDADALLLSYLGGPELWASSQESYLRRHPKDFIRNLVTGVTKRNFVPFVEESKLDRWEETLSFLITYSSGEDFVTLATALSKRLLNSSMTFPAVVCALSAGNIDLAMSVWLSDTSSQVGAVKLHNAIEKLYVLSQAMRKQGKGDSPMTLQYFSEYAGLLASQGYLQESLHFLELASSGYVLDQNSSSNLELFERVRGALEGPKSAVAPVAIPGRLPVSGRQNLSRSVGAIGGVPRRIPDPSRQVAPSRVAAPIPIASRPSGPGISRRSVPRGSVTRSVPRASALNRPDTPVPDPTESSRPIAPVTAPQRQIARGHVPSSRPMARRVVPRQVVPSRVSPVANSPSTPERSIGSTVDNSQPTVTRPGRPIPFPAAPRRVTPTAAVRNVPVIASGRVPEIAQRGRAAPVRRPVSLTPTPSRSNVSPSGNQSIPVQGSSVSTLQQSLTSGNVGVANPPLSSRPLISRGVQGMRVAPMPQPPRTMERPSMIPSRQPSQLASQPALPVVPAVPVALKTFPTTESTPVLQSAHNKAPSRIRNLGGKEISTNMRSSRMAQSPEFPDSSSQAADGSGSVNWSQEKISHHSMRDDAPQFVNQTVDYSHSGEHQQLSDFQENDSFGNEQFHANDQQASDPIQTENLYSSQASDHAFNQDSRLEDSSATKQSPPHDESSVVGSHISKSHDAHDSKITSSDHQEHPSTPHHDSSEFDAPSNFTTSSDNQDQSQASYSAQPTRVPARVPARGGGPGPRIGRGRMPLGPRLGAPRTSTPVSESSSSSMNFSDRLVAAHGDLVPNLQKIINFYASQQLSSMDERMYQESLRKIASLQQQLENQELSDITLKSLGELLSAMTQGDVQGATKVQVDMIQNCWNEARNWLPGFKNIIGLMKKYPIS